MAKLAMAFARETKARILFQHCGIDHVLGYATDLPARDSMAAILKANNVAVLAMPRFGTKRTPADIPADHGLSLRESLGIIGLPKFFADTRAIFPQTALHHPAQEANYANSLLKRLGMKEDALSQDECFEREQLCKKTVNKAFLQYQKM